LNVWVGPVGSLVGGEDFEPVTNDEKRGIRLYFWVEDGRHLIYLQDEDGDENWRLYAVEPGSAARSVRDLTPFDDVQARPLKKSKRLPEEALIELNKRDPRVHDVYRLNLATGDLALVAENPGNVAGWLADENLAVRAALAATPEGSFDLLLRESEAADCLNLLSWGSEDALNSGPMGFSGDGARIFLRDSRGANVTRLVELDLESNDLFVLAEDPEYDVADVLMHPDTNEVQAVAFTRARTEWMVLDEDICEDFAAIKKLHPGDFTVISRDRADQNWLVSFTADDGPASYYAYDRKEREDRKSVV
jgi:dipeptidyl aminopeptidase/acylaminoacyl peptidase